MTIVNRIKDLANERQMSLAELERTLNLSQGSLRKWDKSTPGADKIKRVADYFNVTTDYLLGRESYEDMKLKQARWDFVNEEGATKQLYAIQRKAKKLSERDQEKLIDIMTSVFGNLDELKDDDNDDYL